MSTTVDPSSARWPKATREHPCPKCGKPNRCKIAPDGAAGICWRSGSKEVWRDPPENGNGSVHRDPPRPKPPKDGKTFATPEAAIEAARKQVEAQEKSSATLAGVWTYVYRGGAEAMRVARFDLPDGKQYRPIHPYKGGWRIGDPDGKLPLYQLLDLGQPDEVVYVCEGEKAADAAHAIGLTATTSAHGSASADKSDWTPLAGRYVVILADNDEAGQKYARDVVRLLLKLNQTTRVKVVNLPDLPEGGDIVEFIDGGGTLEELLALVDAAKLLDPVDILGGPVLVNMSTVETVPVEWLWESRIPSSRLTLLSGPQGAGKSFLTTELAARVSTGSPWPDGNGNAPRGSVLIIQGEDIAGDTIKPRLDAARADCSKVELLTSVRRVDPETGKLADCAFTLADVSSLEAALRRMPDCKLVEIDPLGSFIGGRVDMHRDNEIRAVLAPVAALAEKYGVAIILVVHVRKAVSSFADDAVLGSRGITGIARQVWHISRDKANRERRLLLTGKHNVSATQDGLAFTIGGDPPTIIWESGPVQMHADDVLSDGVPGPEPEARQAAEEWLADLLKDGPVQSGDLKDPAPGSIRAEAKEADFSWITVRRAAERLGIRKGKNQFTKAYEWRLPRSGKAG